MANTLSTKWKNFLRGAGSIIDLQPRTRRHRVGGKMVFTRTVFINGRKHQLDAKQDLFAETVRAYQADWTKVTGDFIRATQKLPHAKR